MSDWERAWKTKKLDVGRLVHDGWIREKLAQGFADHPLTPLTFVAMLGRATSCCADCDLPLGKHHTDMLPFDELPPHIQAYDFETGIIAFRIGYETACEQRAGG